MDSWKRLGLGFSALWFLSWTGWTLAIYLDDDIFVFAFVELALGVPLLIGLLGLLIAKTLGPGRGKTTKPRQ